MNSSMTSGLVFGCLVVAVLIGRAVRRHLPENHLTADSKDTVKLAMGLVATMSALVLGLLVSSAKGSYDSARNQVIQIGAKVAFLDRVLSVYGPEAAPERARFRSAIEDSILQIWPANPGKPVQFAPNAQAGDALYAAIHGLTPRDEAQRTLKDQASRLAVELAQMRTQLMAQAVPSVARPLLIVVVAWLALIFLSFSLIAPPNLTTAFALTASAASVAGAVFLILELDRPFGGVLQIPSAPIVNTLKQLAP